MCEETKQKEIVASCLRIWRVKESTISDDDEDSAGARGERDRSAWGRCRAVKEECSARDSKPGGVHVSIVIYVILV
jgi:hypothetical protein